MSNERIVAIIQARMKSSRLPGKVLHPLDGEPMLRWVFERVKRAQTISQAIIATTTDPSDDQVAKYCRQQGYPCFRGDMLDVLDRFYQAASGAGADIVVRITADCPLIDPALVDETVMAFLGKDAAVGPIDFAANRLPPPFHRTYPIGLDTEVCSFNALEKAWRLAEQPFHREHVMPYFYEGIGDPKRVTKLSFPGYLEVFQSSRGFRVLLLNYEQDFGQLRWTVDTQADMDLLNHIVQRLKFERLQSGLPQADPGNPQWDYSWLEVLKLVMQNPELFQKNTGAYHKDFRESEQRD
jgi:spore coat polysaccharide biosynthesis protein SpsF